MNGLRVPSSPDKRTAAAGPGEAPRRPLPAGLGEHNDGAGAAFEGGLHGAYGSRLGGIAGQPSQAPELLEQLPVEGGRFRLPGDLSAPA